MESKGKENPIHKTAKSKVPTRPNDRFEQVHIDKIIVSDDRARKNFGDLEEQARQILIPGGLIEPLVLDCNYNLIAGERRLRSIRLIIEGNTKVWSVKETDDGQVYKPTDEDKQSWSLIPCVIKENMTDYERKLFELLENLSRKDFEWPEKASMVKSIHELLQSEHGKARAGRTKVGWGVRDTARMIGITPADVTRYLQLEEGKALDPEVQNIKRRSTALSRIKRVQRLGRSERLGLLTAQITSKDIELINDNSENWLKKVGIKRKEFIDLVVTDPPWGVAVEENMDRERGEAYEKYDNQYDPQETLRILKLLYKCMKKDSAIYMFWSAQVDKAQEAVELLTAAGFQVEQIPLIWYKPNVKGANDDKRHSLCTENIIYGWKGERPVLTELSQNVFTYNSPMRGRIHSAEKPKELIMKLILLSSMPNEVVVDPYGGSCITADACLEVGRKCVVIEQNEVLINLAKPRILKLEVDLEESRQKGEN